MCRNEEEVKTKEAAGGAAREGGAITPRWDRCQKVFDGASTWGPGAV